MLYESMPFKKRVAVQFVMLGGILKLLVGIDNSKERKKLNALFDDGE
jgi:hypothetical protein